MPRPEHYEMLVFGSGEGGKYLAWHMARSGHRTAVVERKLIGGTDSPAPDAVGYFARPADLTH